MTALYADRISNQEEALSRARSLPLDLVLILRCSLFRGLTPVIKEAK